MTDNEHYCDEGEQRFENKQVELPIHNITLRINLIEYWRDNAECRGLGPVRPIQAILLPRMIGPLGSSFDVLAIVGNIFKLPVRVALCLVSEMR